MNLTDKKQLSTLLIAFCIISLFSIFTLSMLSWATERTVRGSYSSCSDAGNGVSVPFCSLQGAVDSGSTVNGDTLLVYAMTTTASVYQGVTITKRLTLTGKTSSAADAWTAGTAGAASGAPAIQAYTTQTGVTFAADAIRMQGLDLQAAWETNEITVTKIGTASEAIVDYLTLSYCNFDLYTNDRGISVDDGRTARYARVAYSTFNGFPSVTAGISNTASWFFVGDRGTGGSVDGISLTNNVLHNVSTTFLLDQPVNNILISNNQFGNSWSGATAPYGYIYFADAGSGKVQGITITHNTFNDGAASSGNTDEFALRFANGVTEAGNVINGYWPGNMAVHYNNFLQDDSGSTEPITGFETPGGQTNAITATRNWWKSSNGPLAFVTGDSNAGRTDVSTKVDTEPWIGSSGSSRIIAGGAYSDLGASMVNYVTVTQNSMTYQAETTGSGGATMVATRYLANPTGTSLTNGSYYYDLWVRDGIDNVNSITATFYYPTGFTPGTSPARWFDGTEWVTCTSQSTSASTKTVVGDGVTDTYAGSVTVNINQSVTPTVAYLTRTFFALTGSSASSSTTTSTSGGSSSGSSTTTTVTTTSITTTSTTTTASSGGTSSTTTSTSGGGTATTTSVAAETPILQVSPDPLEFSDNESAKLLTITNSGDGVLTWEIDDNGTDYVDGSGWLFAVTPAAGSVQTLPESVTVTVSRKGLEAGSYSARLPVTSNAGNLDVDITMDVEEADRPLLGLKPLVVLLLQKDATSADITISNRRSGSLTWQFEDPVYHRGDGWLTVSALSGVAAAEPSTVSVTVDKENIRPGLYSATLPFRSNAGRRSITIIMLVQEGPVLEAKPFMLLFLKEDELTKTVTLSNSSSDGTLAWEAGSPEYKGPSGWITGISPGSGTLTGEETAEMAIVISRESLGPGLYRAVIPITSNGGTKNINLFLLVPFS